MWKRSLGVAGGTAFLTTSALYSSHADFPVLSASENMFCSSSLRVLSSISDFVHDAILPYSIRSPLFSLYCVSVGVPASERTDFSSYSTLRSFRSRSTYNLNNAINNHEAIIAPIGGTVLATGSVGARGALLETDARTLLGAAERDPLSARGVRVADAGDAASASLRYIVLQPRPCDSLLVIAPSNISELRSRNVSGTLVKTAGRVERAVYSGVWSDGLMAIIAQGGSGRRVNLETEGKARSTVKQGEVVNSDGTVASVVVLFESRDSGFKFEVNEGDVVEPGNRLAGFKPVTSGQDDEEMKLFKDSKKMKTNSYTGRLRRTW